MTSLVEFIDFSSKPLLCESKLFVQILNNLHVIDWG